MGQADEIELQASLWLAREDRGLTSLEADALEAWLSIDTAHRVCYLRLKAHWARATRLAEPFAPRQVMRVPSRAWRPATVWRAIAATLLVAVIGTGIWQYGSRASQAAETTTVYATKLGESRKVQLADGTVLELNTNTRLEQKTSATARTIILRQGEAYFDVAKDPKRPFVVIAGNRKISDIGTRFSVRNERDEVMVLIAQGRVRVDTSDVRSERGPVEAGAGSIVVAKADSTLVTRTTSKDIADRLSWREGMLAFDQVTLASAALEFNRYNKKHIIVVGPARSLRIGGRFRPNNVDVFTSLIKEGFSLKIEDTGTEIIVSD